MSEFRSQLENAVSARHSRLNPFTERWVGGELTRQQLGAWVCQHYQYVSQFPRWCAAVYAECPDADEVHGERGYQIVERHSDTPERRAQALEQVRQATEMRWQYMSGLHRAYVLKEDA